MGYLERIQKPVFKYVLLLKELLFPFTFLQSYDSVKHCLIRWNLPTKIYKRVPHNIY